MKICMGCMEEMEDSLHVCPRCGYDETTLEQESYYLPPGTIIGGKYIVGRVLSYRSFMVKYLGMDGENRRKVVISEYLPSDFSTRSQGDREVTIYSGDALEQFNQGLVNFLNEGNSIQRLRELPGIATVYDCLSENSTGYIISEYFEGESLESVLASGKKYSPREALRMINTVLTGLKQVHQQGIYHCDISPETIFISPNGQVRLLDFGATKYVTTSNSKSLAIILKQGYAPEEQYRSQGERGSFTDIYALGAVMYRMITGRVPQESIERALEDRLVEPSKLGIKIDSGMENALMNALNVFYRERTQTAQVFYQELNTANTKRIKVKKRKKESGKMPVWVKALVAVVACVVLAGGVFVVKNNNREKQGTGTSAEPLQYTLGETTLDSLEKYWENNLESALAHNVDVEYRFVTEQSQDNVVMELSDESESGCMSSGTSADTIRSEIEKDQNVHLAKLVVASTKYYTFQSEWYECMPSKAKGSVTYDAKAYPGSKAIPGKKQDKAYGVIQTIMVGDTLVYDSTLAKDKRVIDADTLNKLGTEDASITIYTGEYYTYSNTSKLKAKDFIGKNLYDLKFQRVHSAGKAKKKKTDAPGALGKKGTSLLCQQGYYCYGTSGEKGQIIEVLSSKLKAGKSYSGIRDTGKIFKICSGRIEPGITLQELKKQGFNIDNLSSYGGDLSQYIVTDVKVADENVKKDQQTSVAGVDYFTKEVPITVTAKEKTVPRKEQQQQSTANNNSNYSSGSSNSGSSNSSGGGSGSSGTESGGGKKQNNKTSKSNKGFDINE